MNVAWFKLVLDDISAIGTTISALMQSPLISLALISWFRFIYFL
jgi:hypothetical protein